MFLIILEGGGVKKFAPCLGKNISAPLKIVSEKVCFLSYNINTNTNSLKAVNLNVMTERLRELCLENNLYSYFTGLLSSFLIPPKYIFIIVKLL